MMKSIIFATVLMFTATLSLQAQSKSWKENWRGNRYFSQGRYAEAVKCYDRALQADTTDARAYFNRGDAYLLQNNVEQAMNDYAKAAEYEKDKRIKAMAFHNMGYVFQESANSQKEQGKKQEALRKAIDFYKESLRNNPKDNGTRYNLALCQKQLKDSQQQQQEQPKPQPKQQPKPQQENKPQQQSQKPNEQPQSQEKKNDPQTQQLLNLSKQAEQRVRKKLNQERTGRSTNGKNW